MGGTLPRSGSWLERPKRELRPSSGVLACGVVQRCVAHLAGAGGDDAARTISRSTSSRILTHSALAQHKHMGTYGACAVDKREVAARLVTDEGVQQIGRAGVGPARCGTSLIGCRPAIGW